MKKYFILSQMKYNYLMRVHKMFNCKTVKELSMKSSFTIKVVAELLSAFNQDLYKSLNCQEAIRDKIKNIDSAKPETDIDARILEAVKANPKVNKTALAEELQISRQWLYQRIDKMFKDA